MRSLETHLEGGKVTPETANMEGSSSFGELLLERLKSETQAKMQLQREMLDMAQQNLDAELNANRLALEMETLRQERC